MWGCRLPVHIGPPGSYEFAEDFRKTGAICRADVGIGPYKGSPWAQGADSPYQGEMARRAKEGRDAGPKGLRGFEHNKFSSTLISATDPLRHFLRKCHLPLPRGARQGEAFASLKAFRQTRIRPYKLLDLYILHTMCQNDVDQLISGAVAFCGKPVKLCQRILANSDCNDPVSVLAALFDNQGIVLHCMVPLLSLIHI